MTNFETLIDDIGGFGRFQILSLLAIEGCQFTAGWSMLQMSFARLAPDFHCLNGSQSLTFSGNDTLNVCDINGSPCSKYEWSESSSKTATTEWSLVCDQLWVQKLIISIQMVGVLIGGLLGGQLSDTFGRKKILYLSAVFHIICNFVTAASSSWAMFCAMRFFTGIGIGAILIICLPYPMEFLPVKWRPICSIIPTWAIGVSVFAAAAIVLDDWSYLHIACGVVSIPSLFGFFFVPESVRWLTMQGKLKEAENVMAKIARINKRPLPDNTKQVLQQIENRERESKTMTRTYSFIDLFKNWKDTKISLVLFFFWFTLSASYYGISFGVASLHGNIFLNIFLLGFLEVPVQSTTFCTNNWFGRRRSSMFFFILSCLITVICFFVLKLTTGETQGITINVLSLIVKTFIGSAWSCIQVWGTELYPTVTRNIGYGFSNSGARFGGILAPFIIRFDNDMAVSYAILASLLCASTVLCLTLPETKGKSLRDSQGQGENFTNSVAFISDKDVDEMDGAHRDENKTFE